MTLLRTACFLCAVLPLASLAAEVDYTRDLKPLVAEKCVSCHGPLKQEGGLRLDAIQLIRQGGDSGRVVVPHDGGASLLLARVAATDPAERMPPEGEGAALNAEQLAVIKSWIEQGLPGPDEEEVLGGPEDHWAYQPVVRPEVPSAGDANSVHPIDALLHASRKRGGVETLGKADPGTLLRRLSLDLVGLPPTTDELAAFVANPTQDAYCREVERLLASPQHAERWARHWMDVWRYSDWDGYNQELRGSQRHIWRWRDWIIESLDADKGYDRMIEEMLAGDELAPEDPQVLRATGFLARNYHSSNRDIWLDATVEHTAKAFLGMTLNCARCHDHKFDPLSQQEYYTFRAIFEPHQVRLDRVPGVIDTAADGLPRAYDADLEAETYLYVAGNEKQPDKDHPLPPAPPQVLGLEFNIAAVNLPLPAYFPSLAEHVKRDELAAAEAQLNASRQQLDEAKAKGDQPLERLERVVARDEARLASLKTRWAADEAKYLPAEGMSAEERETHRQKLARLAAVGERELKAAEAELELCDRKVALAAADKQPEEKRKGARAKAQKEVDAAEKKLAEVRDELAKPGEEYTSVGTEYPRQSSGRRLALARWISDPRHPLTARVAVNHVWMRHFGEPLVAEVFDFGLRSPRPVHADLLDWLAAELVESGWSLKHLHRLIVTSEAYQLASWGEGEVVARNVATDPDNRLLWRAEVRRLDAEAIRDSLLYVAGKLDLTRGGPDIDFALGETVPRRSLYFRHAYEKQMKLLTMFDVASPTECYRRSESIVPQQALALANSAMGVTLARQMAQDLSQCAASSQEFIEQAYVKLLCREPTERELAACEEFLAEQAARLAEGVRLSPVGGTTEAPVPPSGDPQQRARENLVHVMMNHNDFITIR